MVPVNPGWLAALVHVNTQPVPWQNVTHQIYYTNDKCVL